MPRKVNPRWGNDGYHDWQPLALTDDEAAIFVEELEIDSGSPEANDVRNAVSEIGDTYRRWKGRGAGAFNRAQARQALDELLRIDRIDYAVLSALNERAFQGVFDSLLTLKPTPVKRGGTVFMALIEGRIDEATLRRAVVDAIDQLKATKGPDREGDLGWAVMELCRLYEEVTGHRVTHSSKGKHMAYHQEPRSRAGQFVHQCFRLIDNKAPATKISRAMRYFVKSRG